MSVAANLLENDEFDGDLSTIKGNEFEISFDHIISPEDWVFVDSLGVVPLRLKGHSEMIVWSDGSKENLRGGGIVDVNVADDAPFLGNLNYFGDIKIVLEPRINNDIYENIVFHMEKNGFFLKNVNVGEFSNILVVENVNMKEIEMIVEIPGILWVEEIYETKGRNSDSAAILSQGNEDVDFDSHLAWEFGLNGDGVVIAVADTGIDRDHACFRNSTDSGGVGNENGDSVGTPGEQHRKIVLVNDSVDSWDFEEHTQGGHGTHVMGTLSCYDVYLERGGLAPENNMTSFGYNSKLIVQDIVNQDGWSPPDPVDLLLHESTIGGAIISSYSWGDDTTAYTVRSHDLDAWARENPWSIAFIATGNTGGQLLEPANARSVVAVGASTKDGELWGGSSVGNTPEGTRGIFMVAPGRNIISANSDGINNSLNGDSTKKTGTSMATPMGASYAAVVQQLVEDGWITFYGENRSSYTISDLAPVWANGSDENIVLGDGFTPSGVLLKALIAISSNGLVGESHQGNIVGVGPDSIQGWGQPNLSELLNLSRIEEIRDNGVDDDDYVPGDDIWIWDSYRLENNNWSELINERIVDSESIGSPLDKLIDEPWDGSGAVGPFLSTNDEVGWEFSKENYDDDLEIVLSWNPKPYPEPADYLRLVLEMSDGSWYYGGVLDENGWSVKGEDCVNIDCENGEVTSTIRIPASDLNDVDWVRVRVEGAAITSGPENGSVGINGNRIGFALVMKGVGEQTDFFPVKEMENWWDSDWENSWEDIPENIKGDLFKEEWELYFENGTLEELVGLWPEWVSLENDGKTNFDPLVDGVLLVNPENNMVYGVSDEEYGVSELSNNVSGGITFLMSDLFNLNNVTINALKIDIVSEDWNFGLDENNIVVGVGNSDIIEEKCCSNIQNGDGVFNSKWPSNEIVWNLGKMIEDFDQSDFLFTQVRWPSEFSGNLSLKISVKNNENGDLIWLSMPISVQREIDGRLNEVFMGGVVEWKYENGNNVSINNFAVPTDLLWNFTENPGKLTLTLDISQSRALGVMISGAERGIVEYSSFPVGVYLPYCVDSGDLVDEMGGIRSYDDSINSGMWVWENTWLPPSIWDCEGNIIEFEGRLEMDVPIAIEEWDILVNDLNGKYVSYKVGLDFSNIEHLWLDNGSANSNAPGGLICELNLKNVGENEEIDYQSISCDNLIDDLVYLDHRVNNLEFEFRWKEGGNGNGSDRVISHSFQIDTLDNLKLENNVGISISQKDLGIEIRWADGLVPESGWPVFLYDESHDFSHIFVLKNYETRYIEIDNCEGDLDFFGFEGYVPQELNLFEEKNSVSWGNGNTTDIVGESVVVSVIEYNENVSYRIGISGDDYILLISDISEDIEVGVKLNLVTEGLIGIDCGTEKMGVGVDVESNWSSVGKIVFVWVVISFVLGFAIMMEKKKRKELENKEK